MINRLFSVMLHTVSSFDLSLNLKLSNPPSLWPHETPPEDHRIRYFVLF